MHLRVEDLLGWAASLLTLITFAQTSMVSLRVTAILANVFFIAYGALGHFPPILTLHAILLPLNSARLASHVRKAAAGRTVIASDSATDPLPGAAQQDAFRSNLPPRRYIEA